MSGSGRTIAIRLSTAGAEDVRRQLEGIGTAGTAAMRQVGGATDDLSKSLSAAGDALAKVRSGMAEQAADSQAAASGADAHAQATAEAAKSTGDLVDSLKEAALAYGAASLASKSAAGGAAGVTGAFSSVGVAIGRVAASIGPLEIAIGALAVTAGVAISAVSSFDKENATLSNTLRAVGRDAEMTTASLRSYVRALQDKGLSETDANAAISKFVRNSGVSDANIARVSALVPDAAIALGKDAAEAAEKLTAAFSGTYAGVKELDEALNFLSATERKQIETMLEHGDRAGALELEFKALKARIEGMDESMAGPFEQAMRRLSTAWRGFTDTIAQDPNVRAIIDWASKAGVAVLGAASNAVSAVSSGSAQASALGWLSRQLQGAPSGSAAQSAGAWLQEYLAGPATSVQLAGAPAASGLVVNTRAATGGGVTLRLPDATDYSGALAANPVDSASLADQQRQLKLVQDLTAANRIDIEVSKAQADQRVKLRATLLAEQEAAEKGLTGQAREELIRTRVAAAIANQSAATKDHARTIEFYIKDAEGEAAAQARLATAYDQGAAAVQRAMAADKAEKEARKLAQEGHEATAAQVAELTDKYVALAKAEEQVKEAQNIQGQKDELAYIDCSPRRRMSGSVSLPSSRRRSASLPPAAIRRAAGAPSRCRWPAKWRRPMPN